MSKIQGSSSAAPAAAVVTSASLRPDLGGRYLLIGPVGAPIWVADPAQATPFECMREAMRAALRLPAEIKAYGMPRNIELRASALH